MIPKRPKKPPKPLPIKPRPSKSRPAGVTRAIASRIALGVTAALVFVSLGLVSPSLAAKTPEKTSKKSTVKTAKPATRKRPPKKRVAKPAQPAAASTPALSAAAVPEISEKRADLSELRTRINALQKELSTNENHKADAADRLRESDKLISNLQRELHRLTNLQGGLQNTLRELAKQSDTLEATLVEQQKGLERIIYRQYVMGDPGSLQLLLNGDNPNQVARDLYYLSAIAHSRAEILGEIRGTLKKKQALAESTRERFQELADVEAEQRDRHADLLKERESRKLMLSQISGRVAEQRKEIGALQQDEKRMSQLIDRLSKIIAAQAAQAAQAARAAKSKPPPDETIGKNERPRSAPSTGENRYQPEPLAGNFAQLKGQLRLPVRGAIVGRFGAPREGNTTWKGLFIRATAGSEVKSIANGRVVFADWMRGFGNLMIVDHGGDYLSIYGNNDSLLKQVGDSVRGGETVASVGNSGGNPESGLYFELRHQGQAIDPMKWANLK